MQVLPVGSVSPAMGWSPYSSISAFAGNELFINTELLTTERWSHSPMPEAGIPESRKADFSSARDHKRLCILQSFNDFVMHADEEDKMTFSRFCEDNNTAWLDDYAMFAAVAHENQSYKWALWERGIALRTDDALSYWRLNLAERILIIKYGQFVLYRQWQRLRKYAAEKGIRFIGDIPIYVSMDSADAWSNREMLTIDPETLEPEFTAGVPPDYFSETGQLWGNPLYRWRDGSGKLRESTYRWWRKRIKHISSLCDIVRIDHFRGFDAFWAVPAGEETAVNGRWIKGPGTEFFERLRNDLGDLPIIAEDLGVITGRVKSLRDSMDLPGMKILQFAFDGGNDNEYLPHNIKTENCVLYTGTHDNDTTNGWFYDNAMPQDKRDYIMEYLGMKDWSDFHWRFIREAYASTADLVVIPAQDILGYGREFRMNTPGTTEDNWSWKLVAGELNRTHMSRLHRMAQIFSRIPRDEETETGEPEAIEELDDFPQQDRQN